MAALAFYDLYFRRSYAFDLMPPDLCPGSRYIYTRAQDNDKAERAITTSSVLSAVDAGRADPVIGHDNEIDRVVCILCRRTKNCAAGVGKTAWRTTSPPGTSPTSSPARASWSLTWERLSPGHAGAACSRSG
ncbi:hypothetical protein VPH35_134416 [Triticum aestivum]